MYITTIIKEGGDVIFSGKRSNNIGIVSLTIPIEYLQRSNLQITDNIIDIIDDVQSLTLVSIDSNLITNIKHKNVANLKAQLISLWGQTNMYDTSSDVIADILEISDTNITALSHLTGENSGDQNLSGLVLIAAPVITESLQVPINKYLYFATSATADTIADVRISTSGSALVYQKCTLGNAVKGSGTWVAIT